jgi:hypothetical protein
MLLSEGSREYGRQFALLLYLHEIIAQILFLNQRMSILCDKNIISELARPVPNLGVGAEYP